MIKDISEIPQLRILTKRLIYSIRAGPITKAFLKPGLSFIIENIHKKNDAENIELKWKLYDKNNGKLLCDNLNSARKKFSIAQGGKYNYFEPLHINVNPKGQYNLKVEAFIDKYKMIIQDNIDEVKIIGEPPDIPRDL